MISPRRACRLLGLLRATLYYRLEKQSDDADLRQRLPELAGERRRFGYRRLYTLLRREGVTTSACIGCTGRQEKLAKFTLVKSLDHENLDVPGFLWRSTESEESTHGVVNYGVDISTPTALIQRGLL